MAEDTVDVVVEIPKGSRNKYEFDPRARMHAAGPALAIGKYVPRGLRLRSRHRRPRRRCTRRAVRSLGLRRQAYEERVKRLVAGSFQTSYNKGLRRALDSAPIRCRCFRYQTNDFGNHVLPARV